MRVGVPKEIKVHEYRVGLTPASVAELVAAGHEVVVETKAGSGIDCPDKAYEKAGAQILPDAPSVFKAADMIVKVKEPQAAERKMLQRFDHSIVQRRFSRRQSAEQSQPELFRVAGEGRLLRQGELYVVIEVEYEHLILWIAFLNKRHGGR